MNAPSLPPLREELDLLAGPVLRDGQPSHTLHDPVRNRFFQLDWPSFEILRFWHLGDPALVAEAVARTTTLHTDDADVARVFDFLAQNQLLMIPPGHARTYAAQVERQRGSLWKKLLSSYLFFRIPLIRPDRWLNEWAPRLAFLYGRSFWSATICALLFGVFEVYQQWDSFTTTLVDTFTWSGMASYAVALIVVKTLHEFGHAVTAKRLGCRIPSMGVAFLVMWPVAYTDTNDVWRLTSRHDRLRVNAAGLVTEMTVGVWAVAAWALLPEGTPRAIAFVLATTTWVTSVIVNSSPFMRFDGYYILSDWLEMPNMHARAFALARWDLRERLFALGKPRPEILGARMHTGMIVFAWVTWIYRLSVFFGIAALVYTFFIKAVGILLFGVEIVVFIVLPPFQEIRAWRKDWPAIRASRRAKFSAVIALILLLLVAVPWPGRFEASGTLRPRNVFVVYAPAHAQLATLDVALGQQVKAGTVLMTMHGPDIERQRAAALAQRDGIKWMATAGAFDQNALKRWQVSQQELNAVDSALDNIDADANYYAPRAPFDGRLVDIVPDLAPGAWLTQKEPLATLAADDSWQVVTYLDEREIGMIHVGASGRFYSDGMGLPVMKLAVTNIEPDASHTLPEGELASFAGGSVTVRNEKGVLYPDRPIYRVTLKVAEPVNFKRIHEWRGRVVIDGAASVPAWRLAKNALSVFWREAGF